MESAFAAAGALSCALVHGESDARHGIVNIAWGKCNDDGDRL